MAVNLTSDRVRKALQLFEGIQKGQPIEALLGYRFERGMHKIQLDKYIADFRRAFPLEAKSIPNPGSSEVSENKKTASVVDGLAMTKVVNDQDPFKNISLHAQDRPRIKAILDDLVDSVDAMQDLIVAESMYQLTRGNTDRAGALLKSIGEFKPPPVFEVVYTPRSAAHRVTHRICLVFEGELIQSGAYWSSSLVTPMASAESGLNKWLVQMIGDPYQIECTVQESHSDGSISYGSILLSYLPLQPIDLIALINKSSKAPDSALSKRVEYAYRKMNGVADNTPLMINYDQATAGKISFSDILPLLWRLKELIANARPLNASDFDLQNYPEHTNSGNYVTSMWGVNPDIGYLVRRRNAIKDALLSIQYDFYNLQEEDKLRAALLKLANYGYEAAFPKSAVANGEDSYLEIVNQAGAMFTMLNEKLAAFSATQNNTNVNDMSIEGQVKQLITEIKTLTGDTYQILPRFTFLGNEMIDRTAAINAAITNEGTLFKYVKMGAFNPKRYISNWFKSLTRVRPRIANLEMVNTLHNTFQNRNMEWHVAQMPWSLGDAWMALDLPPNLPPQTEKLSVLSNLSVSSNIANSQSTFCGLLLDEWVEEIPNKEETMGITFQHDQPNSQPPQTLLLAISPIDGGKWDWTKLEGILNDTFDRAKRRGVSTKDLINLDWFSLLPGVISEFSHSKANVSLFFGDLMK